LTGASTTQRLSLAGFRCRYQPGRGTACGQPRHHRGEAGGAKAITTKIG